MGAIATGGVLVLNDQVVDALRIDSDTVRRVAETEGHELRRREEAYRGARPAARLGGRVVILVDDGLATGSTVRAAVTAVRQERPAKIVVAVPTGAAATCAELEKEVDEIVCASMPARFRAVGESYRDFSQTSDEEVRVLLDQSIRPAEPPG